MDCSKYRATYSVYSALPLAKEVWTTEEYDSWTSHVHGCIACQDWELEQELLAREVALSNYPCRHMAQYATFTCDQHADARDCPDALVVYSARFDEYALPVWDGGTSAVSIRHCPWCAAALPASKRQQWFDELRRLGFDDPFNQEIPAAYMGDQWYRGANGPRGNKA